VDEAYYPNLIAHAFAVIGLANSRDDYTPLLMDVRTRFAAKAKRLVGMESIFAFKPPVAGGPMFSFVYAIPAGTGAKNLAEARHAYSVMKQCLDESCLAPLYQSYPQVEHDWQRFYAKPWLELMFSGDPAPKKAMLDEVLSFLAALAADHFDAWWAEWRTVVAGRAGVLEEHLAPLDLISAWEGLLGLSYPFAGFRMLLSIPDKTWASSVGPEAIVVGTRLSDERLVASALHEVGVRMLHPHRVLDRPPAGLRAGLPAALPAALTPAQYEHLLRCMEAAVCAEKQALAATLGIAELVASDPFVKSMRLEGLLDEWRTARGDTVLDRLVDMFNNTSHHAQ
jgi:hypothetical protein